jgi:hypothetical protein
MIVDPDFLDHWKTTMLADTLSDPAAPLCVIRLWGHCQQRRAWKFDIPPKGLKALCRFDGDADDLDQALQDSEFITRDGISIEVVGWDEHNATLIANWNNGKKGGRPPKNKPKQNPSKTHGLANGNPPKTHGEPIREDRIGSDKSRSKALSTELADATSAQAEFWLPTNKIETEGETYPVTTEQVEMWQQAYAGVDVRAELGKMVGWLDANASKRKTKGGMKRFAANWLGRAQDMGGSPALNGKNTARKALFTDGDW